MNTMRNYILVVMTTLVLAIMGCKHEEGNTPTVGKNALQLQLQTTGSNLLTRAFTVGTKDGVEELNENKIESLDLFFYKNGTLLMHIKNADLVINGQQITVPVPTEHLNHFNGAGSEVSIYCIANYNEAYSNTSTPEGLLKNVINTPDFLNKGGKEAQPHFIMTGSVTKRVNFANPNIGEVEMKRSAAKITLLVSKIAVPDHSFDHSKVARVKLISFAAKATFDSSNADAVELVNTGNAETIPGVELEHDQGLTAHTNTLKIPFYCYPNDWSNDKNRFTYLLLELPLIKEGSNEAVWYKYIIPVAPKPTTIADHNDPILIENSTKIKSNYLYEINVEVNILGNPTEDPIELTGANYRIKDWSTKELITKVSGTEFLFVSQNEVVMPNISNYTLTFNSSDPNVRLKSKKAEYRYIKYTTGVETIERLPDPGITVQNGVASGTITIDETIPSKPYPKYIEFEIINDAGLIQKVVIKQLPGTFFEATKGSRSSMRNQLPSNLNNPYMYSITTLAPTGSSDEIWGFPPTNSGSTIDSQEVAKMISPKFELASQLGASQPKSYNEAVLQCQTYWEEDINGKRKNGWRLPTEAEIKFIDRLQNGSASSGIGLIMTGEYYWDAYSGNYSYKMQGGSGGSSSSAYTRCIRDVKD